MSQLNLGRRAAPALQRVFVVVAMCPKAHRLTLAHTLAAYNERQLVSFCHFVLLASKRSTGTPDSGVFASLGDVIRTRPHDSIAPVALASKLGAAAYSHSPDEHGTWSRERRYRTRDPNFVTVKAELYMILQDGEFDIVEYAIDESMARRLTQFLCPAFYWVQIVPLAKKVNEYVPLLARCTVQDSKLMLAPSPRGAEVCSRPSSSTIAMFVKHSLCLSTTLGKAL